jgi:nucleotide-binding universal stress UspA family protein
MYHTILHATDLQDNHFEMCEKANNFAKSIHANFHLLHVIEPPATLQIAQGLGFAEVTNPNKAAVEAVLQIVGNALDIPKSNQHVEIGSTYIHALEYIKSLRCDLIILGRHSPNELPAFMGSSAHAIANNAPCDILTLYA